MNSQLRLRRLVILSGSTIATMDAGLETRGMFQTICKLMLIVPLLFAGALLTVHGQRAHDDVRQFLAPTPACAMPCWQGIQPGVTTIDQANALLSANPWIDTVQVVDQPPATYLYWKWSARKPEFAGDPHLLIPP